MFHRISSFRSRGATARRLVKGFGANLLGKFWIAAVQLLLVPVLISAWGADGYGAWLMLTTIPLYILLTDFGMGNALAVELTRAIPRKDEPMARRALQSVWVFMCLISGVVLMIALAADFDPMARIAAAGGPMKTTPAAAQASANASFSERKP